MPQLYYRIGTFPSEQTGEVRETDAEYERPEGGGLLIVEGPCHEDAIIQYYAPDLTPLPEKHIPLPRGMFPSDEQLMQLAAPDPDNYYERLDYDRLKDLKGLRKGVDKLNEKDPVHWDIVPDGMDFRVDVTTGEGVRKPILLVTWKSENYFYEPGTRLTRHLMSAIYRHGFHLNVWEPGTIEENRGILRRDYEARSPYYRVSDHLRRLQVAATHENNPVLAQKARRLAMQVEDLQLDPQEAAARAINLIDTRTRIARLSTPPISMVAEQETVFR